MKKLLFLLILISPLLSYSQFTTINPDTVCYQSGVSIYQVTNTTGLTYNWNVLSPGVIISGQGSNQISVDWTNAPAGLIINAVSVQASTAQGCLSPVTTLNVFIYDVNPGYAQLNDMCDGYPCQNLVGIPPGGVWSGVGVTNNNFCPNNSGFGSFNLTYTYNNAGCTFVSVMSVNVFPQPMLLPIEHN